MTVPIKAKLVAPPFYVLGTNATDRVSAVDRMYDDVMLTWNRLAAWINSRRPFE